MPCMPGQRRLQRRKHTATPWRSQVPQTALSRP
eukprot:CAMPEP_0172901776 /NCGR_PEP_ID=MMETSP1075-20121228/166998_1 /TAXON_ID=2916 /ORGANISM="Ceratium fusus, Strain PA161109" /LENGTH=32 /DNA_ID= /DNA_START= /DNA_END= /DNA_ORIENTATION=